MVFGFGKKSKKSAKASQPVEEEEEFELVQFKGAIGGTDPKLSQVGRLVSVGLDPAKQLITDALLRRAEKVQVEPKGSQARVTLAVDGVAYPGGRLGKQEANAITQMLKCLAGLSIKVRNKPQSGGIRAELESDKYQLSVSVTATEAGERLVVGIKNLGIQLNTLTELGASDEFRKKLRELIGESGFLGIVGPRSSGTTTTALAVLRDMDVYLNQMFTIGDMGGHELLNIDPFERLNEDEDLNAMLERAFRKEASILYLDRIADAETARTYLSYHDKGGLISEFVARDATDGLAKLVEWIGDPVLIVDSVRGIVSQKLCRKLCVSCKQIFRPNPSFLQKAGLDPKLKQLYRKAPDLPEEEAEPCEKCGGIGYFGRIGMFELLEMSDSMKQLIMQRPKPEQIKMLARKEGMLTLQKDGLRLVAEGHTSLDELKRVFKPAKK